MIHLHERIFTTTVKENASSEQITNMLTGFCLQAFLIDYHVMSVTHRTAVIIFISQYSSGHVKSQELLVDDK